MASNISQTLMRLAQVMDATGLKKTQLYELVKRGEFPRSVLISVRCVAWVSEEVENWVAKCIATPRPTKQVVDVPRRTAKVMSRKTEHPNDPAPKPVRRAQFGRGGS